MTNDGLPSNYGEFQMLNVYHKGMEDNYIRKWIINYTNARVEGLQVLKGVEEDNIRRKFYKS